MAFTREQDTHGWHLATGRRLALDRAAARVSRGLAREATPEAGVIADGLSEDVIAAFKVLPGQQGLKLWAPPDAGRPAWSVALNPDDRLFIASVFKGFVLAECLRLEEASFDPRATTPLADQRTSGAALPHREPNPCRIMRA